jgi:hypothetical protein
VNQQYAFLQPVAPDNSPAAIQERIRQASAALDAALIAGTSTIQPRARLDQLARELERSLADEHLARADQENRAAEVIHTRAKAIAEERTAHIESVLGRLAAPAFI